jgi:hypothetical protein
MRLTKLCLAGSSLILSLALFLALTEQRAHACGGCFAPPDQVTTVGSHRMVVALGIEESVLWDQIIYTGSPEDFVWVLPVPSPEVIVELAEARFFDDLDERTAPLIEPASPPPTLFCPQSGGCAFSAQAADGSPNSPSDKVIVYGHDIVGPYETVTIGAEDPGALYAWLEDHNYAITPEAYPAIEHYVGLENAFVVLRLRPGQGVDAMQPVRVRYPGFLGTFPLKMVVVGAQGLLEMSLWIIAEQRFEIRNYSTVRIDSSTLSWDWDTQRSNYREVYEDTIQAQGGRAWVVEHASPFAQLGLDAYPDARLVSFDVGTAYVTRLRTSMLVENISDDMELAPAADTSDVSSFLLAPIDINRPEDVNCGGGDGDGIYCTADTSNGKGAAFIAGLMFFGVMLVLRRRRPRRQA